MRKKTIAFVVYPGISLLELVANRTSLGGMMALGPLLKLQAGYDPVVVGERDPFSPVVGGGVGPTGVTGPTTIPPTSPTTPPTTIPPSVSPPPTPPPTPVGGTTTVIDGHTVTLIDIFHRNGVKYAQVSVDGTVYTVKQGQTFDGNFKLVDPAGGCATFLFGDQQFQLCQNPQK